MRIVQGIVAEYNPFHNGHLYQLQTSAAATGATHTVCVMSGAFVQRGEPACFHKQARVEMALAAGADLVLALPAAFACASAETFAAGAVATLEATGIVDRLCFGSETGDLAPLEAVATILAEEPEEFKSFLRTHLQNGLSFPEARAAALRMWLSADNPVPSQCPFTPASAPAALEALQSPNNILAVEYLKALRRQQGHMKPFTLARRGQGYNDTTLMGALSSATAIRAALFSSPAGSGGISEAVPETSRRIMERETLAGRGPVFPDDFLPILLHRLRTASEAELSSLPTLEPGLILRMKHAAAMADTYDALIAAASSRRYPRTRIQRVLAAMLIGMTATLEKDLRAAGYAQYIRVMGFRESARPLLADMRRNATLPILGKSSQWGRYPQPLIQALLTIENNATDTWALACRHAADRLGGWEHRHPPLRMPISR